jgi:hypothetical protein
LKRPAPQSAHARSLDGVAALLRRRPAAHGLLTGAHGAPEASAEKVEPATHAAHLRSDVAEPASDSPWPAGHVVQGWHAALPALALKVPSAHGAHTASDEGVGGVERKVPAAHTVTAWQMRSA